MRETKSFVTVVFRLHAGWLVGCLCKLFFVLKVFCLLLCVNKKDIKDKDEKVAVTIVGFLFIVSVIAGRNYKK